MQRLEEVYRLFYLKQPKLEMKVYQKGKLLQAFHPKKITA